MSYLDAGYDEFLSREASAPSSQMDALQFEQNVSEVSGSKINNGTIQSSSGSLKMDLDEDSFKIFDGVINRVELGKLEDGSIGLLIRDINGNILMQVTDTTNIIQSFNKHMQLSFNDETLIVTDEGNTPIVLLGKLS